MPLSFLKIIFIKFDEKIEYCPYFRKYRREVEGTIRKGQLSSPIINCLSIYALIIRQTSKDPKEKDFMKSE